MCIALHAIHVPRFDLYLILFYDFLRRLAGLAIVQIFLLQRVNAHKK